MPILANSPAFMQDPIPAPSRSAPDTKHRCATNGCHTMVKKPWPFCWKCDLRLPHEMLAKAHQLAWDAARACDVTRERRMARLIDHLRDCNEWLRRRAAERLEGGAR